MFWKRHFEKKGIDFTQTTSIRTDVEIFKSDAKLFANSLDTHRPLLDLPLMLLKFFFIPFINFEQVFLTSIAFFCL